MCDRNGTSGDKGVKDHREAAHSLSAPELQEGGADESDSKTAIKQTAIKTLKDLRFLLFINVKFYNAF